MRVDLSLSIALLLVINTAKLTAQNVGIGTTSPQSRLHSIGTSWFQGDNTPLPPSAGSGIAMGFSNNATGGYIFAFNYTSFTPRNLWLQSTGGSLLIGSTSAFPAGRLEVAGGSTRAIYATTALGEALYGSSTGGNAITGLSTTNVGMYAVSQAAGGGGSLSEGNYIGAQGNNKGTDVNRQGIRGENSASAGGYAGLFVGGTTWVAGTLQKNAGSFIIDHPVTPETKFLVHSFVESPDMKNIYDGIVITNASGEAIVTMPDWFDALNIDFRYQLTCIGQFAQAIISKELSGNQFSIKTDIPNVKVSWQITGTRNDPYAQDKRIPVEKLKRADEIGKYIYPEGYGKDSTYLLDILKPTQLHHTEKK